MNSSTGYKIVVDSSVILGLHLRNREQFTKSEELISRALNNNYSLVINQHVLHEVMTVLMLRLKNSAYVKEVYDVYFASSDAPFKIVQSDEKDDKNALDLFFSQKKYKGEFLSFVDASVISLAEKLQAQYILTFDKVFRAYKGEIKMVGI